MEVIKTADIVNHLDKIELIIEIKETHDIIKDDILNKNVLFLFVNPLSGSQEGKSIFDICNKYGKKYLQNSYIMELRDNIIVYLFNICVEESLNAGINLIRNNLIFLAKYGFQFDKFKILIGGGDGTVLSIIESLHNSEIDISKCIFGHIPLGTGNDLSNSLGFGSNGFTN